MKPRRPYEQLLETNPLLRFVLPLAVGIALGEFAYAELEDRCGMLALVVSVAILICAVLLWRQRTGKISVLPFFVVLNLGIAALGTALLVGERERLRCEWPEEEGNYRAVVMEQPHKADGAEVRRLFVLICQGKYEGRKIRLSLQGGSGPVRAGDELFFRVRPEEPRNAGNPYEFDYAGWLRRQGVTGTAFCRDSQWLNRGASDRMPFRVRLLRFRDRQTEKYSPYLKGRALAVLSALTLGDKSRMDGATRELFSKAGVSHVLALSGLHLGILFALFRFFVLSRCRRRISLLLLSWAGLTALWAYALLVGLPLSLVRAAVMFTVMQGAACLRRDTSSVNNLALAVLLVLLFSPQSLFDVGFQLSFLSVFSILVLLPQFPVPRVVVRYRFLRPCHDLVAVSLCAWLGTAPLVAYCFHVLPLYFIPANLVAVPVVYVLFLLAVLFFACPFLQGVTGPLMGVLLYWAEKIFALVASLPGAVLECHPSGWDTLAAYLFLVSFIAFLLVRRTGWIYVAAGVLLCGGGWNLYYRAKARDSERLVFYRLASVAAIHYIPRSGPSALWMSSDSVRAFRALSSVRRTFWAAENIGMPRLVKRETPVQPWRNGAELLTCGKWSVAILSGPCVRKPSGRQQTVDYLYLTPFYRGSLSSALNRYDPRIVVLDASLSKDRCAALKGQAKALSVPVYDMRRSGALLVRK